MPRRPDPTRARTWANGDVFHPQCAPIILDDAWTLVRDQHAGRRVKCAECRVWLGNGVAIRRLVHEPPVGDDDIRAQQLDLFMKGHPL